MAEHYPAAYKVVDATVIGSVGTALIVAIFGPEGNQLASPLAGASMMSGVMAATAAGFTVVAGSASLVAAAQRLLVLALIGFIGGGIAMLLA